MKQIILFICVLQLGTTVRRTMPTQNTTIVICFVTIADSIDLLISEAVHYTEEPSPLCEEIHLIVNIQTKIFIDDKKPFVCHN